MMFRKSFREVLSRPLIALSGLLMTALLTQVTFASETTSPGTALVRHAPQISGTVQGSIQQMLGESVSIPGGGTISDELLVPGTPTLHLNGKPAFGGAIAGTGSASPTGYVVTLNGQTRLGHLVTRTNPVALKTVVTPANPTGTRDLTINGVGQSVGTWSTVRNLTLNGNAGQYAVPPGAYGDFSASSGSGFTVGVAGATQPSIYEFQHLTLNARARLEVIGPVIIRVRFDFVENGQAGTSTNPGWLEVQVANAGLTLNGGSSLSGYVFAPNGTAIIDGNAELNGGLECDRLAINGKGTLRLWARIGDGGENQPPVADDQTVTVIEDTPTPITLTAVDPDNGTLSYTVTQQPQHGTLSGSAPNLIYTPTLNSNAADSFEFTVNDGVATSVAATISITVTPVNDAPVATPQSLTGSEDVPLVLNLGGTDAESSPLTVVEVSNPAHGTISQQNGAWIYQPAANYNGPDQFTFKISDGELTSLAAPVAITVEPINDVPTATSRQVEVLEDGAVSIAFGGVDVDGDPLGFAIASNPAHGTLEVTSEGVVYHPAANYDQTDSFTYTASDGVTTSAPATVSITVVPVNDAPTAEGGTVETDEDTPVAIALQGQDIEGSQLGYLPDVLPAHGGIARNGSVWTYTPDADYNGPDAFTFKVSDGELESAAAEIRIDVHPKNDAPIAHAQTIEAIEDTPQPITITAEDVDHDELAFEIVTQPAHGVLTFSTQPSALNLYSYAPAANFDQFDTFTFRVFDGTVWSEPAVVTIHVAAKNDAPVADAGADGSGTMGTAVALNGTVRDIDTETTALTVNWAKISGPGLVGFGDASAASTQALFGAPGTYVLRLSVSDGEFTASDDVTVNVAAGNQAPVVNAGPDQTLSQPGFATLSGTVTDDGLPSGATLRATWSKVSGPGEVTFAAAQNRATTATFAVPGTYVLRLTANDGALAASDELTIEVLQPNTAPQANAGPDGTIPLGQLFTLSGSAGDDGLPAGTGLSVRWSKVSGPGSVVFASDSAAATTASFSATGSYVLRLEASDTALTSADEVTITVTPAVNQPPVVDAGRDQNVSNVQAIRLAGTVTDDGQPVGGQLTSWWSQVSGPAMAEFGSPAGASGSGETYGGAQFNPVTDLHDYPAAVGKWAYGSKLTRFGTYTPMYSYTPNVSGIVGLDAWTGGASFFLNRTSSTITSGTVLFPADRVTMHPGSDGTNPVLRWTVPANGLYTIRGEFVGHDVTTTAPAIIRNGSEELFSDHVVGRLSARPFDLSVRLTAGDTLDFQIGNDGAYPYDSTGLSIAIYAEDAEQPTTVIPRDLLTPLSFNSSTAAGWYLGAKPVRLGSFTAFDVRSPLPGYEAWHSASANHPNAVRNTGTSDILGIDGTSVVAVGEIVMHPGTAGENCVVRFVAPAAGRYSVEGYFRSRDTHGTSTDVSIVQDEVDAIFVDAVNGPSAVRPFSKVVELAAGETLDFQVGRGSNDFTYDSTGLRLTIHAADQSGPSVRLPMAGTYVFRLTATDSELTASDDVTVTMTEANRPPTANAGPDFSGQTTELLRLDGVVSDDGLPTGSTLTAHWQKVSGPGTVTFKNAESARTGAGFDQPGDYVLRLTASDAALSTTDEVAVHVQSPPTVALTAPLGGSAFAVGTTVTLTAEASDADGSIAKVEFFVDGMKVGGTTSAPYSTTWTASGPGDHEILAVATDNDGLVAADGRGALNIAHQLDHVRWDLPTLSTNPSDVVIPTASGEQIKQFTMNGNPAALYEIAGRFQGLIEEKTYTGGNSQSYWRIGGTPAADGHNVFKLQVSDPPQTYYLNSGSSGIYQLYLLDLMRSIRVRGNAVVTLSSNAIDGTEIGNYQMLVPPGISPAPTPYPGQFIDWSVQDVHMADRATIRVYDQVAGNRAPFVSAGPDRGVDLQPWTVALDGVVSDDGLPFGNPLTVSWSQVSGPSVVFREANRPNTSVTLSSTGIYVLRLTASDGVFTVSDDVTIFVIQHGAVNAAPLVNAGADFSTTTTNTPQLPGSVSDDGAPSAKLDATWRLVQGPAAIGFADPTDPHTRAVFPVEGTYLLQLSATDGALSASDLLEVTVTTGTTAPPDFNRPPVIDAGLDRNVSLVGGAQVTLTATYSDDGLPSGSAPLYHWEQIEGPAGALIAAPSSLATSVSFTAAGIYVFRFSGSDGQYTASDTLSVNVVSAANAAPTVSAGADQSVPFGGPATLTWSIADDGHPSGALDYGWSIVSAPGSVQMSAGSVANSAVATFSRSGVYTLRLTASDGALSASDDVQITVTGNDGTHTTPDLPPLPTVTLLQPVGGATVPFGPRTILEAAPVAGTGGTITFVEFFVDGQSLGGRPAAPWSIYWNPSLGSHTVSAVAYDDFGQSSAPASAAINVIVAPPTIRLTSPIDGTAFTPGSNIPLAVSASSFSGITRVDFVADGAPIASDATAPYTASWSTLVDGPHQLTATAVAADGQTSSASITIYSMSQPADAPAVEISSPANGTSITAPTPILGIVDTSALRDWTLDYRKLNDDCGDWLVLATGTAPVNGAALANFDPTLLLNGQYELRLTARDRFGVVSSISNVVSVEGDMKVGHFSVAFQDLQVPLAGIPLTVTRTYDSREHCPGDFGIGWRLDVESLRLEQSAPMGDGWGILTTVGTLTTPSTYQLVDDAQHVLSVRMPDGEVLRFRPKLIVDRPYSRLASMLDSDRDDVGQAWLPFQYYQGLKLVYRAQGGTKGATLRARGYRALDPWFGGTTDIGGDAHVFVSDPTDGPINLAIGDNSAQDSALVSDATGWELTLKDGRVFLFDAQRRLESMRDRVGNVLSFVRDGAGRILSVNHSSGKQVVFHRNADGFVERITDPRGNELNYQYDTAGNLRAFFDREADPATAAATQSFTYKAGTHLLEDLFDGKGVRAARNYFDTQGRLQRTVDANGKETVFTHDVSGRTETIKDRAGNVTMHRYDERGNIIESHTPDGTVTTTAYHTWSDGRKSDLKTSETVTGLFTNESGQLVPKTVTTTYSYEDDDAATPPANDGLLRKVVDPLGNTTRFSYDGSGNLLTVTDPLNHTTINSYYPGTNLVQTVQDALGNITSYTYDARGQLDTETRTVTVVDAAGNSAVQTLVTDTDYDANGYLVKMTDAAGHATTYENDINGNRLFERTTRTNAAGQVVSLVTEHEYDASDRLTRTWDAEHPRLNLNDSPTSETIYDENGKPSFVYDALRRATQMTYTARGELERTDYADGTSESTFYDADGRREFSINRRGKATQTVYDALGRVKNTVFLGGTGDAPVTLSATTYDAAGRVYQSTDANGHTTTSVYDATGRRVATIDALGHVSTSAYDAGGNLRFFTDAKGHTTENVYDALNRRVTTILPPAPLDVNGDGTIDSSEQSVITSTSTGYDELGRRISETDANGLTKRFIYDALGRLVAVAQPSTLNSQPNLTTYSYDELGNQLTQTDANQHTTSYSYDSIGRRLTRTLPLGQVESMQYDAAGNLRFRTDFNGKTTEYQYDTLNRLRFRIPDASLGEPSVEWRYTISGQRERMIDGHGETVYGYDSRDRLTSKASPEGTLSYTYDNTSNLSSITSSNANGTAVTYRYDELNRLHEVEENGGEITGYQYDEVGNLERFTTANGVSHTYAYNALNRLTALSVTLSTQPSTLSSFSYTQLRTGHRSSAFESFNTQPSTLNRSVCYTYDSLYRLTNETVSVSQPSTLNPQLSGSVTYGLDPVGNRLTRTSTIPGLTGQSFTYDANDRLQSDTSDANGNTKTGHITLNSQGAETSSQTVNDSYDSENRLVQRSGTLNSQPSTLNLVYDGDGNKVRETVNGQTISYLIDTLNPTGYAQVVEELQNGTVIRTYTYGHDLLVQDQRDGSGNWSASWFAYDGHGSVRLLTNALGQITDRYDYDAFGVLLTSSGTTYNRYRYCGEQFDDALGLYYLRARHMNAANGRFWNADTYEGDTQEPLSLHKFLYSSSDPLAYCDPSGNWIEPEPLDRAELGVQAHELFFTYCLERTGQNQFYDRPLVEMFSDLRGKRAGDLRPDAAFRYGELAGTYYELKPASYMENPALAAAAEVQVAAYASVLSPRGYRLGDSRLLVPESTPIGIIIDRYEQEYEVVISPGAEFTKIGKYERFTGGMVYYELLPLAGVTEPALATEPARAPARRSWETGYSPNFGKLVSSTAVNVGTKCIVAVVGAAIIAEIATSMMTRTAQ